MPEGPFRFNKVQSPRRDVAGSPIVEDMDGPLMHATDAPFDLVADRDSTHINVVARMGVDFRPDVAANPLTRACSTIRLSGGGSRVETKLQR